MGGGGRGGRDGGASRGAAPRAAATGRTWGGRGHSGTGVAGAAAAARRVGFSGVVGQGARRGWKQKESFYLLGMYILSIRVTHKLLSPGGGWGVNLWRGWQLGSATSRLSCRGAPPLRNGGAVPRPADGVTNPSHICRRVAAENPCRVGLRWSFGSAHSARGKSNRVTRCCIVAAVAALDGGSSSRRRWSPSRAGNRRTQPSL